MPLYTTTTTTNSNTVILGTLLYCWMTTSYCWKSYCFPVTQLFDVIFNVMSHHHSHPKFCQLLFMTSKYSLFIIIVKHCYWPLTHLPNITLENFKKNKIYQFSKFRMCPISYVQNFIFPNSLSSNCYYCINTVRIFKIYKIHQRHLLTYVQTNASSKI